MRIDTFERTNATTVVAEGGYSAPYLYLLDDDKLPAKSATQSTSYTKKKLASVSRAIHSGFGQGRGDAFQPWIRIRRNFSSPTSYQVFDSVGIHSRNHHFLSQLEFHTALLVSYLGASELRECLPAWPFEHPHPDSGLGENDDIRLGTVVGLIDIARAAGIEHGYFVGTKVPYIASIDLMFKMRQGRKWRLLGISCKPRDIAAQSKRAQERIELDRLYCIAIGGRHVHEDGSTFNHELLKQLRWMRPLVSDLRAHQRTAKLTDFCALFGEYASERCIADAVAAAGRRTALPCADAHMFFRLGVWLHLIDIDLTQRVQMRRPIKRGCGHVLQALTSHYIGVAHE